MVDSLGIFCKQRSGLSATTRRPGRAALPRHRARWGLSERVRAPKATGGGGRRSRARIWPLPCAPLGARFRTGRLGPSSTRWLILLGIEGALACCR